MRTVSEPLQNMVEQAKKTMKERVIEYLLQPSFIDKDQELYCVNLAHDLNYAFPTNIGIATTEDYEMSTESGGFMSSGNSVDIYSAGPYSFDNRSNPIEFTQEETDMFDNANNMISDAYSQAGTPYDEEATDDIDELLFDAYVDVCKGIDKAMRNSKQFTLSEYFHVTAVGFDQSNELKFLKALLPEDNYMRIESTVDQ